MTWVKLDDKFWANPKVQKVGNEAAGAYARMLSYCGDHLTDGIVTDATARFITRPKVIETLAEFGFLLPHGEDWRIPEFLDFNPPRSDVEAMRKARSEAGRRGGQKSRPTSNGASK